MWLRRTILLLFVRFAPFDGALTKSTWINGHCNCLGGAKTVTSNGVEDENLNHPSVDGGETDAFPALSVEKDVPYLEIIIGIVLFILIIIAFAAALRFTFGEEVVSWFLGIAVVIASLSVAVAPLRFLIIRSIRRLLPQDPDQRRQQRTHWQARQLRREQRQQRRQSRRRRQ